ncbi:hypothetical protein AGLY_005973 [Aphis glycines]|uniref:Uncharacterized protein n=1 Tax=Aphis glycines TaxID=307491 RepID=A0A6G0TSD6_APHGL|nr:hypothetical protein AGLY_005973 [Aphis glycines]
MLIRFISNNRVTTVLNYTIETVLKVDKTVMSGEDGTTIELKAFRLQLDTKLGLKIKKKLIITICLGSDCACIGTRCYAPRRRRFAPHKSKISPDLLCNTTSTSKRNPSLNPSHRNFGSFHGGQLEAIIPYSWVPTAHHDSERSNECIDFTMIITSRNNASISNFGGGFRWKSEYPWCIKENLKYNTKFSINFPSSIYRENSKHHYKNNFNRHNKNIQIYNYILSRRIKAAADRVSLTPYMSIADLQWAADDRLRTADLAVGVITKYNIVVKGAVLYNIKLVHIFMVEL